ncbi:E3 ubiquitin-protein ligase At1g63170-like [Olea europaea var. sylvestris]|uniref:E3 ubiquitin-protein ligase At1g63170-like n=1 Tax=Olea europaea var. sylvestris TaxID=158386 RepID=UPI000C1D3272|nr:E3 ubiquitin-protein ligase At1g63170-like [Olea europaea var. sylvestris]XP_022862982.1 E3 ubiquitin-protein ligase At1g63170-like [Olea europaea var. sylvestris]
MGFPILGLHCKSKTNNFPLLMEQADDHIHDEHVIDMTSSSDASSSTSSRDLTSRGLEQHHDVNQPPTSVRVPVYQPPLFSASTSNSRSSSLTQRGNGRGRRRSPLNSGLWISVELALTVSQIIAAMVVLSLSRHESPHAPLKTWVVGYASGCVAILPLLYWRFRYRNNGSEQDSTQHMQGSSQNNFSAGPSSRRVSEVEDRGTTGTTSSSGPNVSPRLRTLVEYFKMALDCFFAVWFVVGNVWIFGGHSSSTEAPNLYRLCIVFLTFSCIGYAMPFILCTTICCCLPCIISVLGFREDLAQNRGATQESINSLPTYKFKVKKSKKNSNKEINSATDEAGIVAAGTEKERVVSGEDAVCCICLAKYVNNDELRELPCSHFFHKECVDKWLKINASCPLCKAEVGETVLSSLTEATASLRQNTMF